MRKYYEYNLFFLNCEKIHARFQEQYEIFYNFPNDNIKFSFFNHSATIKLNERSISIQPNFWFLFIKDYTIFEGDIILGKIKNISSTHSYPKIIFQNGETYKFKRIYKNLWDKISDSKSYNMEFCGNDDCIKYIFSKGEYFEDGPPHQRYRKIEGSIEIVKGNFVNSLMGLFIIELILEHEGQ